MDGRKWGAVVAAALVVSMNTPAMGGDYVGTFNVNARLDTSQVIDMREVVVNCRAVDCHLLDALLVD